MAGGMHGEGACMSEGGMHGNRACVVWGVCMVGPCVTGVCMAGCMAGGCMWRGHVWQGVAWQEKRPLQQAVRILLECILVSTFIRTNRNLVFACPHR